MLLRAVKRLENPLSPTHYRLQLAIRGDADLDRLLHKVGVAGEAVLPDSQVCSCPRRLRPTKQGASRMDQEKRGTV